MKKSLFLSALVLAMPMMAQNRTPKSVAEIVAAMPAVPTVEQIYSVENKEKADNTIYAPFTQALQAGLLLNEQEARNIDRRIQAAGQKQKQANSQSMEQYNANVNAGLMPSQEEMMQLYMSGEIKENMSDAQIMDVMAGKFAGKWGVSKQEYLKIISMAQSNPKGCEAYLKANHPQLYQRLYAANAQYGNSNVREEDPREPALGRIGDDLTQAQENLTNAINNYAGNVYRVGKAQGTDFDQLRTQMENDWENSAENKQIAAIEEALQNRIDQWYGTVTIKGDVQFPAWYTTERKKENALIDQWNRRWATKWQKIAQEGDQAIRPIYQRVAALETENEQLGRQGDSENFLYLMNKKLLSALFAYAFQVYQPANDALAFPAQEHVEETGYVIVEK